MNRRDFLFLRTDRGQPALELSCEQLYMRYVDSQVNGTTAELFENIQRSLSAVRALYLADAAWLSCEELRPVTSLIADFQSRGGRVWE